MPATEERITRRFVDDIAVAEVCAAFSLYLSLGDYPVTIERSRSFSRPATFSSAGNRGRIAALAQNQIRIAPFDDFIEGVDRFCAGVGAQDKLVGAPSQ